MKKFVRINIDGSMNDLELLIENRNIVNILNKNSNTKGKNNIRHLYSWTKDNIIIKCFGWYDGTHDCINKHELIPYGSSKFLEEDSSTILLYGDIYLLSYYDNKVSDFGVSDYANFYNEINEGFDDCDTDDDDTEEEYHDGNDNEDNDYKMEEDDEEDELDFEIINTSDSEELEEDKTNY
jgi:hypothetical protein|tara:strand:+ start:285 stop:824 length:540 start_codon:yes stop_codon:yes gene_type:complete